MKTPLNTKSIFLISILVFVTVLSVSSLIFWKLSIKKFEVTEVIKQFQFQETRKEEVKKLSREIKDFSEELEKVESLLLGRDQEAVVNFIERVENIALESQVNVSLETVLVSPLSDEKLKDNFENLNLEVTANGGWEEIIRFLGLIENLPYQIIIKDLSLEEPKVLRLSGEEVVGPWTLSIVFDVLKVK